MVERGTRVPVLLLFCQWVRQAGWVGGMLQGSESCMLLLAVMFHPPCPSVSVHAMYVLGIQKCLNGTWRQGKARKARHVHMKASSHEGERRQKQGNQTHITEVTKPENVFMSACPVHLPSPACLFTYILRQSRNTIYLQAGKAGRRREGGRERGRHREPRADSREQGRGQGV